MPVSVSEDATLRRWELTTSHAIGPPAVRRGPCHERRVAIRGFWRPESLPRGARQHCGVLFQPDEYVSYSNGGMIVAGRLLEVAIGTSFHDLLRRELCATVMMILCLWIIDNLSIALARRLAWTADLGGVQAVYNRTCDQRNRDESAVAVLVSGYSASITMVSGGHRRTASLPRRRRSA
jgi:hypothetical protein